ncbi:MAG: radical SAM protein [Thermotogae bacterium]|nr:radical SAM protein [Thermotogota bacterium]
MDKRGDRAKLYEVRAKSILTPSRIPGITYSLNPYVGCAFACRYCYASFMIRFKNYKETWGNFVEIKLNAPQLLEKELGKKRPGTIEMSLVCDPYQPIEERYGLTRACLEVLLRFSTVSRYFPLSILTKSPLVLRDIDLLKRLPNVEIGFSIGTHDEAIRRLFEPKAPSLQARLQALKKLKEAGIRTYALVAPVLPMDPERLASMLKDVADRVYVDCLNYPWKVKNIYMRNHLESFLTEEFCWHVKQVLTRYHKWI